MGRFLQRILRPLWLAVLLAPSPGCLHAMYGIKHYQSGLPKVLRDERFTITIDAKEAPHSDFRATDYLMLVQVKNISQADQLFDTGELELKDLDTGISYFSVSKDKDSVTVPSSRANTLTKVTLEPAQKIEGVLWFPTPDGKATANKLELRLHNQAVLLEQ